LLHVYEPLESCHICVPVVLLGTRYAVIFNAVTEHTYGSLVAITVCILLSSWQITEYRHNPFWQLWCWLLPWFFLQLF